MTLFNNWLAFMSRKDRNICTKCLHFRLPPNAICCSSQCIVQNRKTFESPPNPLDFQIPQWWKCDKSERSAEPDANISTGVITNQSRHRSNKPDLGHTNYGTCPPNQKRQQCRQTKREILLILPSSPIEPNVSPEDEVFLENDRNENHEPITHEGKEILEYREEVVAACNSADEVDGDNHANPKVTGDGLAVATKNLTAKSSRICPRNIV